MSQIFKKFTVASCADGSMQIDLDYCDEYINEDGNCGLGLFDRMAVASAIEECLNNHVDVLNLRLAPVDRGRDQ